MKKLLLFNLILFIFPLSLLAQQINRPNIVVILMDDAGLMDFGAFGGEAETPNIDQLAKEGIMFTNMHASPVCAPSRAMLMTGCNSHLTGIPNLPEMLPKKYQRMDGYEGVLNDSVKTIATRLKELDYKTYATGKWHLGHDENTLPNVRGFDQSFILAGSGADNYEQASYLPFKKEVNWYENGVETNLPENFYSSEFYIDQMINYHKSESGTNAPFFSYIAFQAVHAPIQAPKAFVEKYVPIYEKGWDTLRAQRFQEAKKLGIIPINAEMKPMFTSLKKWEDVSAEDRKEYIANMAMLSGMIEATDYHIGRYIDYLKSKEVYDNTVFIITSDNGPDGGDYSGLMGWAKRKGYHRDFENKGGKRYYGFIGPEFASAVSGPFSYFKYYTGEGGLRVPLVITGPNILGAQIDNSFCFITDLAPTIYDLAGLSIYTEDGAVQVTGNSLKPRLANENASIYKPNDGIGLEAGGCSAYFLGDYKIVRNNNPYGDFDWKMYNLKLDPTETQDISSQYPLIFQDMLSRYETYTKEMGVIEMPKSYNAQKEVAKKSIKAVINPFK